MIIKEAINIPIGPSIPENIRNNISIQTTCEFTENELKALQVSLLLLSDFQKSEPFPAQASCTLLCSHLRQITMFEPPASQALGLAPRLIVLFLEQIRRHKEYQWSDLILVFLEEMCHALYYEPNEYRVKQLVCRIVNQKYSMSLHKTYPSVFDEHDHPISSAYPYDYFYLT